jgi:hypothetical protein
MSLTENVLKKYKNDIRVFVETGTYMGDGVQQALQCRFDIIYSIEFYEIRFKRCEAMFKNYPNVHIIQGESGEVLPVLLEKIDEKSLFWLDAHFDVLGRDDLYPSPLGETQPLMKELEAIQRHHIKNHTILIDDRRIFTGEFNCWHNIKEQSILDKLKEINSDYRISFADSKNYSKDIIVAEI